MPTYTDYTRPGKMGIGESLASSTSAPYTPTGTAGMWIRVNSSSAINSSITGRSNISDGEIIRVSTNSTYAVMDQASLGDAVIQPASGSGGAENIETIGELTCYQPLSDENTVDCAARTVHRLNDCTSLIDDDGLSSTIIGPQVGYGVRRSAYNDLVGDIVHVIGVGAGNPDGKNDVTVANSTADVSMTYDTDGSGTTSTYTLSDVITVSGHSVTTATRGAPVFDSTGSIVGMWVGVDDNSNGVIQKAKNIERAFGGRIITGYRMEALQ